MTIRDTRLERLQAACELVNSQTIEDMSEQSLKVAGNLMLMHSQAFLLTGEGFIIAINKTHEAALMWLLAEGYVTLTDKALATDEVQAERAAKRAEMEASNVTPIHPNGIASNVGAYL